jgi:hypothetical protein
MQKGSTLFLKSVIYLIGIAALGLCVILLGVSLSGNAGMYLPITLAMVLTSIPFFFALYQGVLLLSYIDKNSAFSALSVAAIRKIKYCAFMISVFYALLMPLILYVAEKDDAPGVVAIALVIIFATLVTGVFAAVLEKLLQNAIDIKSENDLTV